MSAIEIPASAFQEVADDTDMNDLLVGGAGAIGLADVAISEAMLVELEEAIRHGHGFDEGKHPRWPKGTPKGGQFIRVGQHLTFGGKQYQVAHVLEHKVVVHLTGGKQAATVELNVSKAKGFTAAHPAEVAHVPGISAPVEKKVKGGRGQDSTVTLVMPYVDHATHDPSIPIPEGSPIKPDEWKRFGKLDQEYYTELQGRHGAWQPGAAQAKLNGAYKDYQDELSKATDAATAEKVTKVVKSSYDNQYSSSSGVSLSLIGQSNAHTGGYGNEIASAHAFELREQAMVLQGEHKAVVHWDLYNRTHSPDIAAFHKSPDKTPFWEKFFGGHGSKKAFSGLSQTFHYTKHAFGDTAVATPLAIRHILLATQTAQPSPSGQAFASELEISVPEQMQFDKRSFVFTASGVAENGKKLSANGIDWLTKHTSGVPRGAAIIDELRKHFDTGEPLSAVPEPAMVQMDDANGKAWKDPEPQAWKGIKDKGYALTKPAAHMLDGEWFLKGGKSYKVALQPDGSVIGTPIKGGDGTTITIGKDEVYPVAQPAITAGLSAGDYIQGLQGSRYIVVDDPSDTSGYGLRRIEGTNDGQVNDGYNFSKPETQPFFRLEGKYTPTPVKAEEGIAPFEPLAWSQGTEERFLSKWEVGSKFKVNGVPYEITDQMGSQTRIKDLNTGKLGKVNATYKTAILVPKAGGTADTAVEPIPVVTPQKGDFVGIDGKKWTVSITQKNGLVRLTTPGEPYKARAAEDPIFDHLHRPSDYVIGPKQKLRDIPVGTKFHVGAGAKQKPYLVLSHGGQGQPTLVRDLSTGKELPLGRNTSYSLLVHAGETATPEPETPKHTPQHPDAPHDPTAYVLGASLPMSQMDVGTKFRTSSGGDYQILGKTGDELSIMQLSDGFTMPITPSSDMTGTVLLPKSENATAYANLTKGDLTTMGQLKAGDRFKPVDSNMTYTMLKPPTIDDSTILAAVANGDGSHGPQFEFVGATDGTSVKFHAFAKDVASAPQTKLTADPMVHAETLPAPPDFKGYGSPAASGAKEKGGFSGKHDKISMMAPGTIFRSPGGALWKVKESGATPIITDGEKNYQIDGQLRGRASLVMTELPQGDTSPPTSGEPAAVAAGLQPNYTLLLSDLGYGDQVELVGSSHQYNVIGHAANGDVTLQNIATGKALNFQGDFKPEKVALHSPVDSEPSTKVSAAVPAPPAYTPTPAGTPGTVKAHTLPTNESFFDGDGTPMMVVGHGPGVVHAIDEYGDTYTIPSNENVTVAETSPVADGAMPTGLPNYDAAQLDTSGGKGAGGSTGAKIVTAKDGTKFLLKTYGGNEDRVATELLANSVYREMGAKVASAGTYSLPDGKQALAYPLLDGKDHPITEPSAEIGKHYMTDALVANHDFIGLTDDNILWDAEGKPFRVDQGGTFQYRAQGKPKPYGPVPEEVWSMFDVGQAKGKVAVTDQQKRAQAQQIAQTLTPEKIDALVAAAPFANKQMAAEVAQSLKARVEWMAGYAQGKNLEPGQTKPKPSELPTPPKITHTAGVPDPPKPVKPKLANTVGGPIMNGAALQPGDVVATSMTAQSSWNVVSADLWGVKLEYQPTGKEYNTEPSVLEKGTFVLKSQAADVLPAKPETSDTAGWSQDTHEEGPWKKVGDFKVGEVFKGANGGYHQILAIHSNQTRVVRSLKTGKVYELGPGVNRRLQVPKGKGVDAPPPPGPAPDFAGHVPLTSHTAPAADSPAKTAMQAKFPVGTFHSDYSVGGGAEPVSVTGHTPDGQIEVKNGYGHGYTVSAKDLTPPTPSPAEKKANAAKIEVGKPYTFDGLAVTAVSDAGDGKINVTTPNGATLTADASQLKPATAQYSLGRLAQLFPVGSKHIFDGDTANPVSVVGYDSATGHVLVQTGSGHANEFPFQAHPKNLSAVGDAAKPASVSALAKVQKDYPIGTIALDTGTGAEVEVVSHTNGGFLEVEPTDGDPYIAHPGDLDVLHKPDASPPLSDVGGYPKPPIGSKHTFVGEPVTVKTHHTQSANLIIVSGDNDGKEYAVSPSQLGPPQPAAPAPASAASLQPFKSPSGTGGVYKHPKLATLPIGQKFVDKTGTQYVVVGHSGGQTLFELAGAVKPAAQLSAPNTSRVKTHGLPQVEKGSSMATASAIGNPPANPQAATLQALAQLHGSLDNIPEQTDFPTYPSAYSTAGVFKYPQVGELPYGTQFTAKGGGVYTYIAPYMGHRAIIVSDTTGDALLVASSFRVKLKG